jgi:flavin-dependent dehydrogenase
MADFVTRRRRDADAPPVIVIGAGLTGMATACLLAARGFPVNVLERDDRTAFRVPGEPPRLRRGAPQAEHPHTLAAGGRDVLRRSLPAVLAELYALGGRDTVELPGDAQEVKVAVSMRRSLLEQAYFAQAFRPGGPAICFGEQAYGVVAAGGRVAGVRTRTGVLPAGIVIDTTGKARALLRGPRPGYVDLRSLFYYTSQPLKLTVDGYAAARGAASDWSASTPDRVTHARLFFHDQPYATLLVVLDGVAGDASGTPDGRTVLDAYQAMRTDPQLSRYLASAEPLGPIRSIGFGRTRLRLLSHLQSELPDGGHQIGDALMAIEPLTSRGMSLGLITAEALTDAITEDPWDHVAHCAAVSRAYRDWLLPHWADGAVRGGYLRADLRVPAEVGQAIVAAKRRLRWQRRVFEAVATVRQDDQKLAELQARRNLAIQVNMLVAKPSAIDRQLRSASALP